jgi:hypothetical protein
LVEFGITIEEVIISDLIEGIFYAQLVCNQDGNVSIIDSRTSDAIAMAVRFNAPIYTYEFVMEAAGITVENENVDDDENNAALVREAKDSILGSSISELEQMLEAALQTEDYEQAAKIRDEINKRKS